MKKLFFSLLFISVFTASFSQDKKGDMSLEDAVLGYYKGLYPSSLTGLSWTLDNQYTYQSSNEFIIINPNKTPETKKRKLITLEKINDLYEGSVPLNRLPWKKSI